MAGITITDLPNGVLTPGSLFAAADVNSGAPSGYSSGKHSAAGLADGILGVFEYTQDLDTTNKTIFGAINELQTGAGGVVLTGTLTAGATTLVLTDVSITNDSMFDFYTSVYGVNPTAVSAILGQITLTFEQQAVDVGVKVVVK